MKKAKSLTKKERKAIVKAQKKLAAQNPKPPRPHTHDMMCLTSYLQRQAEAKHAKMHAREERRNSAKERKIAIRKAEKAQRAAARAKREARLGKTDAQ
jgi:hypothetical protein